MAVFVCLKEAVCVCLRQMLYVQHNPAYYCRDLLPEPKNTSVSVSGTHSLLFSPSHSCINTLTHTENTRKSLSETGWACVGSEITVWHTFPLSILQTVAVFVIYVCLYIWALCHLRLFIRGTSRCNFQGCHHLNEQITEDGASFSIFHWVQNSAATSRQELNQAFII